MRRSPQMRVPDLIFLTLNVFNGSMHLRLPRVMLRPSTFSMRIGFASVGH